LPTPDLFRFATSELSQEPFLVWLLSWADRSHQATDPALYQEAQNFLARLLALGRVSRPAAYDKVVVALQRNKIDLLIEVNDDIVVIIEHKTHTEHHSNQLERYRDLTAENHSGRTIAAVDLKTGDQSSDKQVEDFGYRTPAKFASQCAASVPAPAATTPPLQRPTAIPSSHSLLS